MIKTIIFDFGDVFIDLDKSATLRTLQNLGNFKQVDIVDDINVQYEIGKIGTTEFLNTYASMMPNISKKELTDAWNAILLDFPKHRLNFIKELAQEKKYTLLLLSNTNELHIDWIKEHISFYEEFKQCFNAFYLSHEIHLRKPNKDIFEFVLEQHQLTPSETLFIDDTKANTDTAKDLGIHVWNNNPQIEDITDLFTIKSYLF